MPSNNRKNKNKRIPKYKRDQNEETASHEGKGLGKSVLLLVEGETELDYFEGLKKNSWLRNNLAGVVVKKGENLGKMKALAQDEKQNYRTVWIVCDHDKRNSFILEEKGRPFFESVELPEELRNSLRQAYLPDKYAYFLSIYDYLQWLKQAIGAEATIEFWDRIHFFTPKKPRELADFVEQKFLQKNNNIIRLAYTCIAFEYWLILHFQQVCQTFLWVDKGKDVDVDVATHLRTIPNFQNYEKGKNIYASLYDAPLQIPEASSREDDWKVLHKIMMACENTEWLRSQMQPTLDRQAGKWYEVNPYILGMDELMFTLLNIHHQRVPIDFFGLTIQFDFSQEQKTLRLQISVDDGEPFTIDDAQRGCFEIKSVDQTFLPTNVPQVDFPNALVWADILFEQLPDQVANLVLVFRDPRTRSKSHPLFILIG